MVQILFGISALPKSWRLAATDLIVVLLIVLGGDLWSLAFITADGCGRVLLLALLLDRSELLVDSTLVA